MTLYQQHGLVRSWVPAANVPAQLAVEALLVVVGPVLVPPPAVPHSGWEATTKPVGLDVLIEVILEGDGLLVLEGVA